LEPLATMYVMGEDGDVHEMATRVTDITRSPDGLTVAPFSAAVETSRLAEIPVCDIIAGVSGCTTSPPTGEDR
jgi:hypothetical protein